MEYFIFDNINSQDLGIIIKEMPPISIAEKDIEIVKVSGRNGNLHIDNDCYNSKIYKIKCVLINNENLNKVKELHNKLGLLELSTEPNIQYNAIMTAQIDFEKYLTYLKEFTLEFELYPIGYSKNSTNLIFNDSSTFEVGGNYKTPPQIKVNGIGSITLNNVSLTVLESGINIDCDLMNCTKENLNKNDKVILDTFPSVLPGSNSIFLGVGVNSVEITYKEGWL